MVLFVSSYSTYLHANTTDKTTKDKESKGQSSDKLFDIKSLKNANKPLANTPINHLTDYKALKTKAQIQQQVEQNTQNNQTSKFITMNSQVKASSAYTANSTMFSLMPKNQPTLKHNTQKINQNLPQEIKDLKESFLKIKMVNTYISNNSYYQITA